MSAARPRVLVCEDSRTYAAALTRTLEHDDELEVVGVSTTGEQALAALAELHPDLVTMDMELPGMHGLEAVERIMSTHPTPILVVSSRVGPNSDVAAGALAAGALDALAKDDLDLRDPGGPAGQAFRRRVLVLSGTSVIRHPRANLRTSPGLNQTPLRVARAIGICASIGGPQALVTLLGALPASFRIPVLVVQHIAVGFTDGLARWLDSHVPLPVQIARDGATAESGIWLAPDDAHLRLEASGRLSLDYETVDGLHRPSGDVLLRSLAANFGTHAVSVVLTGMGHDGAEGTRAVRDAGGLTIAQDEASSVVFGMPQAAADAGIDLVLPLDEIGPQLVAVFPWEPMA